MRARMHMSDSFRDKLVSLGCGVVLLGMTTAAAASQSENVYQLYLVRHAQKQITTSSDTDPKLSPCGQAQAKALATLLQHVPIQQIYHTPYQRTLATASALLQPERQLQPYQPSASTTLVEQLLQQQQTALIVGHSNTIPALANLLSQTEVPTMHEQQYGLIYQLSFRGRQFVALTALQLPQPDVCQTNR